jgi:hypothetical protein
LGKLKELLFDSLGSPALSSGALHKGLEKSNTFLSASDTFLREPITELFPFAHYWLV